MAADTPKGWLTDEEAKEKRDTDIGPAGHQEELRRLGVP
jgi:hypothetical protein